MPSFTFKVEGIHPALAYIDRIITGLDTGIEKVLKETAEKVASDAQGRAPVDTGNLRDNIRVTESSATRAVVEAQAGYSGFVEFGTMHMSAQPFFYDAVQSATNDLRNRMADSIR